MRCPRGADHRGRMRRRSEVWENPRPAPPPSRRQGRASCVPRSRALSEITFHTRGQATCCLDGKTVVKYPRLSWMEDRNFTFNSVGFLLIQQFCLGTAQKIIAVVFRSGDTRVCAEC